jgi:hypothetical protein
MVINSRSTKLNPEQINNAMVLRSVKKTSDWLLFFILKYLGFSISKLCLCI